MGQGSCNPEQETVHSEIDFSITAIQHIIERRSDAKWEMDSVLSQDLYVIGIALCGQANYTINNETFTVAQGGLILVPPCATRTARSVPEDPWHFITIGCRLHFADALTQAAFATLPRHFPRVPEGILQKCRELAGIWNCQSRSRVLMAKGLIYEIFFDLLEHWDRQQHGSEHFDRISKAQDYIRRNYAGDISQSELAQLCGYSESHFRRLFRSVIGMSCTQYILSVRIGVAKNLLLSGTANVSEAAYLTGFSDIYHFSKMFKKVTGYAPSHYRA